jgi:hypothetical protein
MLVCSGVYAQDTQNIDADTAKVAKNGYNRISIKTGKLFFRGLTGTKKEVVSTNNSYVNPSWISSLSLAKITGLQDSLSNTVKKIAGKSLSVNDYTTVEKTKLAGVATGATANSSDATLLSRTNHTGVQSISTVSSLQDSISKKIDKVTGKALSTNDYTNAEKTKLAGVATGATANSTDATLLARANHTGTQTSSTISDFQANVSTNTDVTTARTQAAQALTNTNGIVSGQVFKNSWNASTNTPTLTTTPSATGDFYIVSVAGTQSITGSSTAFLVGDRIISNGAAWVKTATSTVIANSSITPEKTNFLKQGKNLFDKSKATLNFFLGNTDGAVSNTTYAYTDYMPVLPSTTYYGFGNTGMRFTTYYDANKAYVAGGSSNTIASFTTPANVYFVRVTFEKGDIDVFQFEKGSARTAYERFVYKLDETYVLNNNILTDSYADSSVTDIKLKNTYAKANKTKNLFDKTKSTLNFFLANTGGTTANTEYGYSDYMPVLPSTSYFGKGNNPMRFTTYYDANKVYVAGGSNGEIVTFTTPANVYFVRVTFYKTDIDLFQFEQGSVQTAYTKPYVIADNVQVNSNSSYANKGKVWSQIGDSITQQAQWQSIVTNKLELFTGYNYGRAGTKISGLDTNAIASQRRIDQIKSTSDIIVFMGGTNDWANDVALGTIADTSSTVFYGAVKNLVKRLTVKFPTKLIVGISTPWGKMPNRVGWNDTYGLKNNLGLTTGDYAKVVENVCKSLGIYYIDIYSTSGINDYNYIPYFTNDGAFLHPNTVGGVRFGNVIANALFNFNY